MLEDVPEAAQPYMAAMAAAAASIHDDIDNNNLQATIPKVTAVRKEMEAMLPTLTNPVQKEMYQYLLLPWIRKLEVDVNNGKATKRTYDVYYTFKSAILRAGMRFKTQETPTFF